jgi:type III pantothenate kinase
MHCNADVHFARSEKRGWGVTNSYRQPRRLGVDRWVAMIGAFAEFGGSVCIVDAGTAITVDSLDESGRHLGGVIAPGYRLMLGSLASGTSDLDPNAAPPEALAGDIFATDTLPAIQRGAAYAMAALVDRVVTEAEKSLSSGSHLVLTGGDAEMIQPLLEHDSKLVADLILRGLAMFARN